MKSKKLFLLLLGVIFRVYPMESPSIKKLSEKKSDQNSVELCRRTFDIINPTINCGLVLFQPLSRIFLISENPVRSQCPVNNLQLITAVAALGIIGGRYQFETTLKIKGRRNGGTLNGNLYLIFSGDPLLTTHNLTQLMKALADKGIKKIRGTFYCYGSVFDEDHYAQGNNFKYNNPDHNYPIDSCIIDRKTLSMERSDQDHYKHVDFLLDLLRAQKISFEGDFEKNSEVVPADAQTVMVHKSLPLLAILQTMLKSTDYLIADCIFKLCGTYAYDEESQLWSRQSKAGSWSSGQKSIKRFMEKKFNFNPRISVLCDGSGRSSSNLISPQMMAAVLDYIAAHKALKEAFIPAFPHREMVRREQSEQHNRNSLIVIRGSIGGQSDAGASALSGYLILAGAQFPLIFSCMCSNLLPFLQKKDDGSVAQFEKLLIERLLAISYKDVEKEGS